MNASLRILHLEDDRKDAELIWAVLEDAGIPCSATRVQTRDDFVGALAENEYDLILADFSLPSFDGLSALKIALQKCPEVPFIFVSGTLGEEVAIDALKIGATDYVLKERLSRIVTAVRRALSEARNRAERRQAEQRLRRSEAFLAEGQRISRTGSWSWSLADGKVAWSDEHYRMLGFAPGTVEPSVDLFLSVLHPEDRTQVGASVKDAMRARLPYAMTYRAVLPDGSVRHLRSEARPVAAEGGEIGDFIGITADITERVQTEAALRARQDMLDLAQKAARAVAFELSIGAGHRQNCWSPDLDAMHGLAPGAYDVTFETWSRIVHPDDRSAVRDAIARAGDSGDIATEYRVVHPDGALHWLEAKGRMFCDDAGRPARIVGFIVDVTGRHRAEEELRRLESRLRQAEKMEAIGRLAGGIAHDFNNVLAGILAYGEMLFEQSPSDSAHRRYAQNVLAAAARGRGLVEQILTYSRSHPDKHVPVDITPVVAETLELLRGSLPADIVLEARIPNAPLVLISDPTQLHQVAMNLCSNAIQAMAEGGSLRVTLEAVEEPVERTLSHCLLAAGRHVRLSVEDTGIGMDEATLAHVFEPFFTTKGVGKGTGLGLSLVYAIVTDSGGGIDVTSAPRQGSTFAIYLPLLAAAE
ncbi:MAG TPA: PAS domain-containing protein [Caldimonas sp.]|jgi:PAS domain S-box-containing protein|nr:PAS domain-containing protein [Caldimonas sp.]HEV7577718.1 PAS domain-containing protein [Caldimonas sp.]